MLRLLLLRHAKAERLQAGGRDRDRPLAERGRADAMRLGHYLVRHSFTPDLAMVSPAARTRETWTLACEAFPDAPATQHEDRLYDASVYDILGAAQETPSTIRTLLIVGHNPGLHELALLLVASGDLDARQRLTEGFSTCALAVVDFPFDRWDKLHPQSGRLERFVSPKTLTAATD
jgi:phosphohistidine phosphatase